MQEATVQLRLRRRGTILIVAMIILFALASTVLVLGRSMRTEAQASANELASRQAAAIERGAEQFVLAYLSQTVETQAGYDESYFEAVPVGDGYFWIVRPDYGDPALPAFGLVDESAKLDLNSVELDMLRRLPGMTEELAASIIDWRDQDEEVTSSGAESQVYLSRIDGYSAKNAPFETVEELSLVYGMTPELLHGQPEAAMGETSAFQGVGQAFASDLYQRYGLFDQFTVWGRTAPGASGDEEVIDIGRRQDRDELRDVLRNTFGAERANQLSARIPGRDLQDIFDLARETGMTSDELAQIEPSLISGQPVGRININQAPREVIGCLDDTDSSDVDILLANRPAPDAENAHSVAWVLDALGQEAVGLGSQITGRGGVYSADIVAAAGNGRAFRRVRIVVDITGDAPRIIYRRDLTADGWPLDMNILDSLRQGTTPSPSSTFR